MRSRRVELSRNCDLEGRRIAGRDPGGDESRRDPPLPDPLLSGTLRAPAPLYRKRDIDRDPRRQAQWRPRGHFRVLVALHPRAGGEARRLDAPVECEGRRATTTVLMSSTPGPVLLGAMTLWLAALGPPGEASFALAPRAGADGAYPKGDGSKAAP